MEIINGKEYPEGTPHDQIKDDYKKYLADGRIQFVTFHQSYGYEEFIEGIRPETTDDGQIRYDVKPGIFKKFCEDANGKPQPYVFIIDEINRGNISKIFGELITLIEDGKRDGQKEQAKVTLPYSGEEFTVPGNVYIIGTMNTADRSIAAIDTALRRRFSFVEMMPDMAVLNGVTVNGIDIPAMLALINKRIEVLYDREHTIGHAYFIKLLQSPDMATLADIFKSNVIPLLQEYFYEDYEKIRLVLADNQTDDETLQFITRKEVSPDELFGAGSVELDAEYAYSINKNAFENARSYIKIYRAADKA